MRRTEPVFERMSKVSVVRNPNLTLDPWQERTVCHAGCREDHILGDHVIARIDAI